MLKKDAIAFFGSNRKIAEVLGLSQSAVRGWREVVPLRSALRIQEATFGNVKVDMDRYDKQGWPIRN